MKNTKTSSSALAVEHSEEAERSEAGPTAVGVGHPNPEVVAKAKRRIFTGEYKQRVLAQADKAKDDSKPTEESDNGSYEVHSRKKGNSKKDVDGSKARGK